MYITILGTSTHAPMDVRMDEQTDGWMNELMGLMNGWNVRWMKGQMDANGCMHGFMDGWTYGSKD